MQTEKLYELDSHLTVCSAVVLEALENAVVLNRTVFFPEGGGQPSDIGTFAGIPVLGVQEKDGRILHYLAQPLPVGTEGKAVIDWEVRLDHMQQHSGEHLLSYAFWHLFDLNNIGFHMGQDAVTIDLDGPLTREQLDAAEDFANRQIWGNLPVHTELLSLREAKKRTMRKATDKAVDTLRVVSIENSDMCTCCGTHVHTTGEIGVIKILRAEKHKNGCRIFFLCGRRALLDYRSKNTTVLQAGAALSARESEILPGIERLREELSAESRRLKDRSTQLTRYKAERLIAEAPVKNGRTAILVAEQNLAPKEAKNFLSILISHPNTVAGLFYPSAGRLCYLWGRSSDCKADCRMLCELANGLFNGKGGGRTDFAQGSGQLCSGWEDLIGTLCDHMLR